MKYQLPRVRNCACGHEHPMSLQEMVIESGALQKLPGVIAALGNYTALGMVCDENTYEAAGRQVQAILSPAAVVILNPDHLHANEAAVAAADAQLPPECDLLLAVGSGTIHDTTRFVAHRRGIPFVSVPTAPSVDGFVSTVAAMTWGGLKVTMPAVAPIALVADSNVFSRAPRRLVAAGVADLLGKYTALLDWKVSHLITGEYICQTIIDLEMKAVDTVAAAIDAIAAGDKDAMEALMYALVLSGLAMQMVGNSRPASGAEHHVSHLWEMEVINPEVDALHGEKVGIGLILACNKYHSLLQYETIEPRYAGMEEDLIREKFGPRAPGIFKENGRDPLLDVDPARLRAAFPRIRELIRALPTGEEMAAMIRRVGGPTTPEEIGLSKDIVPMTLRLSPYVRRRLTLMRLTKAMGLPETPAL